MHDIGPLGRDRWREGVSLLADAFQADPIYRWLVPEPRRRRRWLPIVLDAAAWLCTPDVVCAAADDGLLGVLAAARPGSSPSSLARSLRATGRILRRAHALPRPVAVLRGLALELRLERLHPTAPHWYLSLLAVRARARGRGVGRRLLEHALARADADGVATHLETTNEPNLGLYERFGFQVTHTLRAPGGCPPVWGMTRPAGRVPDR